MVAVPRSQTRAAPALLEVLWPLRERLIPGVVPSLRGVRQVVDIIRQWFDLIERGQVRKVMVRMLDQIEEIFLKDCPHRSNLFRLSNKELLVLAFLCNHIAKCYPRIKQQAYGPQRKTIVSELGLRTIHFLHRISSQSILCGKEYIDDRYMQRLHFIWHDLDCRYASGEKERAYFLKSLLLSVVYNNMSRKWHNSEFIAQPANGYLPKNEVIGWDLDRLIPSGNVKRGAFQKENASLLYSDIPLRFHCPSRDMQFLEVVAWSFYQDSKKSNML
ncbi:MAG: hypothetical protein AAB870_04710 [Patescibacteria group bacterium]